jgi:hypothetical protein
VAAGQLELTGGAQPIFVFFSKSTKNKYTTTFGSPIAQKKYAQTTPLDDGVSSLLFLKALCSYFVVLAAKVFLYKR